MTEQMFHPEPGYMGVTKRDWLAGMAMQGICAGMHTKMLDNGDDQWDQTHIIAKESYEMADAMIAEGGKE